MTIVLIGKDLVLEGSRLKIEDKQVPGIYIYIYDYVCICEFATIIHRFPHCYDFFPTNESD